MLLFSQATGLTINLQKTNLSSGLTSDDKVAFAQLLGVSTIEPPIRYLGIPLIASRLGVRDCLPLIEKVSNKVKNWKNKMLSFAGRLELVHSVLTSFHVYWSRTFIIPKAAAEEVARICARYLWGNNDHRRRMHQASIETITKSKEEGGLGITNIQMWNKAAYFGLVFKVAAKLQGIWVQWVWKYQLRNKFFWTMAIPTNCSWVWRNVLKARKDAAEFITYSIANGETTLLWHDLWCGHIPLWLIPEVKRDWIHILPKDSKVSMLLTEGKWNQYVRLLSCTLLQNQIRAITINKNLQEDRVIWLPSPSGKYNTKSAYQSLSRKGNKVSWHRLVWGKLNSPKHSFTLWQLFSSSLLTQDRLTRRKLPIQSNCIFCLANREYSKHLFFECSYSREVWRGIKNILQILIVEPDSTKEWRIILKLCRKKDLKADVIKAFVAATVNNLWMERNSRRFRKQFLSARDVINNIVGYMKKLLSTHILETTDWFFAKTLEDKLGISVLLKRQEVMECKWTKPPSKYYKLNTDGSLCGEKGGYGGIIRNEIGIPIIAFSGGGTKHSIEELEMIGILQGCRVAKEAGCNHLIVNLDSLRVILAIQGKEATPWYCENHLEGTKLIRLEFMEILFEHCYRECNRATDQLAKHHAEIDFFLTFIPL